MWLWFCSHLSNEGCYLSHVCIYIYVEWWTRVDIVLDVLVGTTNIL